MRRYFYDIFRQFGVFAAVRNVVFPAGLLEREKMKPIFSTEQARYQKFASFFIDALGCFAVLRESMRDAQTFGGCFARYDARPRLRLWKPPPFKKGGRKLSRLGVAVNVCIAVALGSAVDLVQPSSLAQLFVFT